MFYRRLDDVTRAREIYRDSRKAEGGSFRYSKLENYSNYLLK
jgi:hypothetical protein